MATVVSITVPTGGGGGGDVVDRAVGWGDEVGREGVAAGDVAPGAEVDDPTCGVGTCDGSDVGKVGGGVLVVFELLDPEDPDPPEPPDVDPAPPEPPAAPSARVPVACRPSPVEGTAMNVASNATKPTSTAAARTRTSSTVVLAS